MAKKQKKLDDISKKFGDEREKALNDALKLIEKDFGKGSIMRLGERAEQKVQVMSSGSLALDIALGAGGYPKGRIIEIYGPESSGKTTVALHAVAQAQKEVAFWILLILGRKDLKSILIAGFGSGLGFQIIEDLGYVARQTRTGDLSAVTEAVNRISGGLASHAVYTAVVSVGAFLILSQCTKQKEKLFGLWCVVSTVTNHFLWNSPFYETDHRVNILVGLLFAFQVGTFIEVVLFTHKNPNLNLLKKQ